MKVAVTYENDEIFQHFGHTAQFKVFDINDGKITTSEILNTNGSGHGALAGFLKDAGVATLICGGIGGGAKTALTEAGISIYGGCTGNVDKAVQAFIKGELVFNPDVKCTHHDNGEHKSCGEGHSCSSHK